MKTVDEVISTWTDEEREQHKDLIAESKKREELIQYSWEVTKQQLLRLDISIIEGAKQLSNLNSESQKLLDYVEGVYLKIAKPGGTV